MSNPGGTDHPTFQEEPAVALSAVVVADGGGEAGSMLTPVQQGLERPTGGPENFELSATAIGRVAAVVAQAESTPNRIGPYHLIEVIGHGGMGEVWRAEQEQPIRRTVAVKLIKAGMDTRDVIARFEAERQTLALMNHPNVAKVLDAGATDAGRPYFVMEYVPGEPITAFCDRHAYAIRQRLDLFSQACSAVGHAHQKGILHRDLKAGNILVTAESGAAQVKVIDFGIAKALLAGPEGSSRTSHTLADQVIGTPEYMSPEQALTGGQDVDTRSDIYSLGVVLYELLGGCLPFDSTTLRAGGLAEIQRIVRDVDPPHPSTRLRQLDAATAALIAQRRQIETPELARELRSELEWIPLKAMRKEPSARYATTSELAQDVRNYLEHNPLLAGPESRTYRFGKFLRRRRVEAVAASLVLASLLAGMVGTITFAMRESRQRTLAEHRADETTKVANFQADMLRGVDVRQYGQQLADDLVEEAERSWRASSAGEEEIARRRAELRSLLSNANFTNPAIRSLHRIITARALQTIERQFSDQPRVKARLLQQIASTLRDFTLLDQAMPPQKQALEIRIRELGEDHLETLDSMTAMGFLLGARGEWAEAESYARRVLEHRRRKFRENDPAVLHAKRFLAETIQRQGRAAEAEPYRMEVMHGFRNVRGDDGVDTLDAILRVGQVLLWQKKFDLAQAYLEEALTRTRRVLGNQNELTLIACQVLGRLRFFQGNLKDAEALTRESYDGLSLLNGDANRETLFACRHLGAVYLAMKDYPNADLYLRRALTGMRSQLTERHTDTLLTIQDLGNLRYQQKNFAEADAYLSEALEGFRALSGEDAEGTLWTLHYLGGTRQAQGGWAAAEPLFRELHEKVPRARLPAVDAARMMADYGPCLVGMSRYAEAERPLLDAYERLKQARMERNERTGVVIRCLVDVYEHTDRPADAARWRAELARWDRGRSPTTDPATTGGDDDASRP